MGRNHILTDKIRKDVCRLIANGNTDKDVCGSVMISTSTFYRWLQLGRSIYRQHHNELLSDDDVPESEWPADENFRKKLMEFWESVTRARAKANTVAVSALRSYLKKQKTKKVVIEVFSETRLDKSGQPYEYVRKVERSSLIEVPPDWRAAVEYLKRRERLDWGDKSEIGLSSSSDLPIQLILVENDE